MASSHCFLGQVKVRTSNSNKSNDGSHVMEYGDKTFKDEKLFLYQGFDPSNANITNRLLWPGRKAAVNQRDADLLFMWKRVNSIYFFSLPISLLCLSFE